MRYVVLNSKEFFFSFFLADKVYNKYKNKGTCLIKEEKEKWHRKETCDFTEKERKGKCFF